MTGLLAAVPLACVGACGGSSASSVTPTEHTAPSRDPAVVQFRTVIGADMRAISFAVDTEACKTRSNCIGELVQIQTAIQTLLTHLGSGAPAAIEPLVKKMRLAAQEFSDQVAAALVIVKQPNSNYFAAGAAPTIHDLYLTAAYVDCWPALPVNPGGEGGYSCS